MVGPCSSCGPYNQYCGHQPTNANTYYWPIQYETDYMSSSYASASSSLSPPSSVDCTLSLGTPSTRLTNIETSNNMGYGETTTTTTKHRNSVSTFCWDLLHPKQSSSNSTPKPSPSNGGSGGGSSGDPLFGRRCSNCDTTSTPLWRNGPRGPKSLCNACGIRFKKEERRAAAATTTAANNNAGSGAGMMDPHHGYYNGSWAHQYTQAAAQKMQCYGATNEYRFTEDDRGSDSGIQFLSWLTHDRPSGLVRDFTR
ncbi:GATA transcription factor 19-like [Silene latifolia]|uniref:GATA transcription factor 19-like n=1 Tax=Silene latifolia TaxID=37657 RepID=UPI003D782131